VSYRLLIRSQAKRDLQRAAKYYEKRLPGLGSRFVAEVESVLNRIEHPPLLYQVVHRDVRRAIASKFPYGIFYRIDRDNIVVFAIVHLHRDVDAWRDRL
jgi:plasmid stabilization system protein ParE